MNLLTANGPISEDARIKAEVLPVPRMLAGIHVSIGSLIRDDRLLETLAPVEPAGGAHCESFPDPPLAPLRLCGKPAFVFHLPNPASLRYNTFMEIKEPYEVIIVGGGAAGLVAGLYCQRAALKTVLFEKGLIGGQIAISKDVENYPGVEHIVGFELAERLVNHAKVFGLNVVQEEVASIEPGPDLHTVRLANGEVYRTVALILAAGGSARKLDVPGEAEYLGRGVSYCATCDGLFFRGKTVAVVGGGDSAVEEALYLSRVAKKVFLLHRRSPLRASRMLPEPAAAEPSIEMVNNTKVTAIRGDGKGVTGVDLESSDTGARSEMAVDGVFIFIGYAPNTFLLPDAAEERSGVRDHR